MRVSPPSSSPCLHGHGGKVACAVAACLALVTFLVVALDPRTGASSWFLSSSSSPPGVVSSLRPTARGGSNGGGAPLLATSSYAAGGKAVLFREEAAGGGPAVASFTKADSGYASVAPAPALAPESGFDDADSPDGTVEVRVPLMQGRVDVKLERVELGLAKARLVIREAIRNKDKRPPLTDRDYVPVGPVYRNAYAFHRSYLEMEKLFKVYVYEEGEPPVFHDGPCRSIYSSEGRFIFAMEMENRMRTRDPELAHVFFLPFSVVKMVKMIYEPNSHDMEPLRRTLSDYIDVLSTKYPYWNRSLGADHFMLSCHDWGAVCVVGGRPSFLQLHPRAVQRQHLRGLQPFQGRVTAGDQPPDRHRRQSGRRAISVAPPHPGLLRRRRPWPGPSVAPAALEGQGCRRAGERVPAPGRVVHQRDAAEQVLPVPQWLRGGQPQGGGGHLPRVRAGGHRRRLRAALQRRAQLARLLGAGRRGGHTQPQDHPRRRVAAAVHTDAAEGEDRAPALHGERPAAPVRRLPHDPPLHMAQEAQRQAPWTRLKYSWVSLLLGSV
uniref:Exostosin GT47 domain-containing protein n=1 Tax=Aegilops tauschii subsp. strangulata TaxID=200361 RepID=A0A453JLX9_AEGTS